ncbi:Nif3-like dinuclear metal center hexameric protein [Actinocrinis puniceicyclus]|uniref:GTP cyclohydrolase 1 type 2 homolog n=1 Tax=Actinocrinis puniceicyclus TaxID=977794 RepID=A0A8J7WUC3_9ACTN|nr:Nif3-like dinuclear metal center hexameric protein [Actinocrinis puniceicyclus]MBS2965299.1 Nif3-like dinuclear metal center hexameric protein [Actinocrinis puniceicyclus]
MPTLADVVGILDAAYDPRWAEPWDAVGLVCGDPAAEVRKVLFAVDPVDAVVEEALAWGADLLVTHHPLLLRPVHGVAATTFKGRAVHRLIRNGVALLTAHTNADVATPGVSDALARALDLSVIGPIRPAAASGPGDGATGSGSGSGSGRGLGRFGVLPEPEPLRLFAQRVALALPPTSAGVRVAGDPERTVRLVAVCGGAGDDRELLAAVRDAGADAYVTADLRHHPVSEALEEGEFAAPGAGPALVDVSHWASEWPWLSDAAAMLTAALGQLCGHDGGPQRGTVEVRVSQLVTDPWTLHAPQK